MTFHSVGHVIIPTDFHSIIFQRGLGSTTKQEKSSAVLPLKFSHGGLEENSCSKYWRWSGSMLSGRMGHQNKEHRFFCLFPINGGTFIVTILSMGDLQDPIHGGTLVPYFWPYFFGYIPLQKPTKIGLIYGRYLQSIGSWNGHGSYPANGDDCRFSILDENLSTRRDPWYSIHLYQICIPWYPLVPCNHCRCLFSCQHVFRHSQKNGAP